MKTYFAVMIGGATGSLLRYLLSVWIASRWGETFPWGTLLVNVIGSFGVGFFSGFFSENGIFLVPATTRAFMQIGLFGGFTTFSSFSLQTLNLVQDGEWLAAGGNIFFNLTFCLVAVWLGHTASISLNNLSLR